MNKADDLFTIEDENGKVKAETYTNFELLQKEVEVLKDTLNVLAGILRDNNLERKDMDIKAPYFDEDEVLSRLESESPQ